MCGCTDPSSVSTAREATPTSGPTSGPARAATAPVIAPAAAPLGVPLAQTVVIEVDGQSPESLQAPEVSPVPQTPPVAGPFPTPFPPVTLPFKFCGGALKEGCYSMVFTPTNGLFTFNGTLRVDRSAPDGGADNIIVSGDLYRGRIHFPHIPVPVPPVIVVPPIPDPGPIEQPGPVTSIAMQASTPGGDLIPRPVFRPRIPIFARNRYSSYLKVISVSAPVFVSRLSPCTITLVAEQYDYTQPPAGSFTGSFPAAASRTVSIELTQTTSFFPFHGPNFEGRWVEGGVDKGAISISWVSRFFRRATVEIDTLAGAVAPQPVPDGAGGTEYFDTIYAKHGWDLTVISDQTGVAAPVGVDPDVCWSNGDLHNLMTANRDPATNLDTEWHMHLSVVPARLGCGRGVMYDTIDVPREGAASFCDDGYPSNESASFGAAADHEQRDVPRAFLRSATHEITHTFNQIHQEQETAADNSIMTTTPSVANVLGGPATGDPGVFPDQINLGVNSTVRHHLNHMPDPVIRPGGWPFASWFGGSAPQAADRHEFAASELALTVAGPSGRVVLGQPMEISWTMTNTSGVDLVAPSDVSLGGLFASATVTDADGVARAFRPYVIACETVHLATLGAGESVSSDHRVFWSSEGFAFPRPGRYRIDVVVSWSAQGVPVGVSDSIEVFVEFPTTDADNSAAGLVLSTQVGKWVALGGGAYHLTDAVTRLRSLAALAPASAAETGNEAASRTAAEAPRLLSGFEGLLPN